MKKIFLSAVFMLALAACQTTTGADGGSAVDGLVGKRLVAENGTVFVFNRNGTMGGSLDGEPVVGTYKASETEVCSSYTSTQSIVGRTFCSKPEISGDTVVFNRRDGSRSQPYKIGG